ncbi:MAG: hypothetical protein H8E81_10480 [Deltaproteobacteria bacterium]|nr:hypothetical protein [Deltaproteobacteria bacterium]
MGLQKQIIAAVVLLTTGLILPGGASGNINIVCDSFMYRNKDVDTPITQFSALDRIVIQVKFKGLQKGSYTFQADWYNPSGEFQDTSSAYFTIQKTSNVVSESELELMKAGSLRRMFSTSETLGYHIKFYGVWKVKLFLNGEKLIIKEFEIR